MHIILLIYLFITFAKQHWWENRFFVFKWHRLLPFFNFDMQAVLCNCFVPFVPLYRFINVLAVSVTACYFLVYL